MNNDKKLASQAARYLAAFLEGKPLADTTEVALKNDILSTFMAVQALRDGIIRTANRITDPGVALILAVQLHEDLSVLSHMAATITNAAITGATRLEMEGEVDRSFFDCPHFGGGKKTEGQEGDVEEPTEEEVKDWLDDLMDEVAAMFGIDGKGEGKRD